MGGRMMNGGMMVQITPKNSEYGLSEPETEVVRSFQRYCGQCHAPPDPAIHTERDWPRVIARMRRHMETQGKAVPDRDQLREITAYLQRHAR